MLTIGEWAEAASISRNHRGSIRNGRGVLYLEDMRGNAIASQKLRSDDNALQVAVRLFRDRGRNKSSVAGFYDTILNNGRQIH